MLRRVLLLGCFLLHLGCVYGKDYSITVTLSDAVVSLPLWNLLDVHRSESPIVDAWIQAYSAPLLTQVCTQGSMSTTRIACSKLLGNSSKPDVLGSGDTITQAFQHIRDGVSWLPVDQHGKHTLKVNIHADLLRTSSCTLSFLSSSPSLEVGVRNDAYLYSCASLPAHPRNDTVQHTFTIGVGMNQGGMKHVARLGVYITNNDWPEVLAVLNECAFKPLAHAFSLESAAKTLYSPMLTSALLSKMHSAKLDQHRDELMTLVAETEAKSSSLVLVSEQSSTQTIYKGAAPFLMPQVYQKQARVFTIGWYVVYTAREADTIAVTLQVSFGLETQTNTFTTIGTITVSDICVMQGQEEGACFFVRAVDVPKNAVSVMVQVSVNAHGVRAGYLFCVYVGDMNQVQDYWKAQVAVKKASNRAAVLRQVLDSMDQSLIPSSSAPSASFFTRYTPQRYGFGQASVSRSLSLERLQWDDSVLSRSSTTTTSRRAYMSCLQRNINLFSVQDLASVYVALHHYPFIQWVQKLLPMAISEFTSLLDQSPRSLTHHAGATRALETWQHIKDQIKNYLQNIETEVEDSEDEYNLCIKQAKAYTEDAFRQLEQDASEIEERILDTVKKLRNVNLEVQDLLDSINAKERKMLQSIKESKSPLNTLKDDAATILQGKGSLLENFTATEKINSARTHTLTTTLQELASTHQRNVQSYETMMEQAASTSLALREALGQTNHRHGAVHPASGVMSGTTVAAVPVQQTIPSWAIALLVLLAVMLLGFLLLLLLVVQLYRAASLDASHESAMEAALFGI